MIQVLRYRWTSSSCSRSFLNANAKGAAPKEPRLSIFMLHPEREDETKDDHRHEEISCRDEPPFPRLTFPENAADRRRCDEAEPVRYRVRQTRGDRTESSIGLAVADSAIEHV